MGRPTRQRLSTVHDRTCRDRVREDALVRLSEFGSDDEFELLRVGATRVLDLAHAGLSADVLRRFEALRRRESHVFLYTYVDHLGLDDRTVVQRFLAEGWAPPAEREYLAALAASPRRVWRTQLLPGGVIELRDFWTGARRRRTFAEDPFEGPLPALLAARVVMEPGPLLHIPADAWSLPQACAGELQGLATLAAASGTPWGRQRLAQAIQAVADRAFAELFILGERRPFLSEAFRARFRIVADEGLERRVLPAAGFERLAGNRWFEARTDRPEAGLIALRIGRKGGLTVTGSDEMAVRLTAHRLQEMAGRRLCLRGIVEVGDPAYHAPPDPSDDELWDWDSEGDEPTDVPRD